MGNMLAAALEASFQPTRAWQAEHPTGGECPPEHTEVAIRLVAVELRQAAIITGGEAAPKPQQRSFPVVEFVRIPLLQWQREMSKLFGDPQPETT